MKARKAAFCATPFLALGFTGSPPKKGKGKVRLGKLKI